jgi:hypothetical protein
MTVLQELELLDAMLWIASNNAFTALATKHFLNQQFYGLPDEEMKKVYKTNVANNILYAGNSALLDSSVVDFYEHILWHNDKRDPKFPSDDLTELRKHRVIISHSATIEFKDPKVQTFYKDGKQYRDNIAVRVWRIRSSVLSKIADLGGAARPPLQIIPQVGTAELIWHALNLSLKPESKPFSIADVQSDLPGYFKAYQAAIEKFAKENGPKQEEKG